MAKFRALRQLWVKITKERFNAKNLRSMMLRYHVQTDGFTLTEQQPLNNITRVTIQALAAVMGCCQSLHTNSFDEALALPAEQAIQVALRTQQIIAEESGVADTVDPLAVSYFLESLTNRIEEGAMQYLKKIDEIGGALEAIRRGYIQGEIALSAYNYQKAVDSGEQVNKYIVAEEQGPRILEIDETVEKRQKERLAQLKRERDNDRVKQALAEVRKVAARTRTPCRLSSRW